LLRRPDPKLTLALVAAVLALDALWALLVGSTGPVTYGFVDEPAHLATCAVLLLAVSAIAAGRPPMRFAGAALIATVAIDVDHLPGLLGSHLITGGLPRPYSHSIALVVVLIGLGVALRRVDRRLVMLGLAFGVSAHLIRDLATGPGVPLLWPLSDSVVTMPYAVYAAVLSVVPLAATLTARPRPAWRRRSRLAARPLPSAGPQGGS
jgi:inner membrane protein